MECPEVRSNSSAAILLYFRLSYSSEQTAIWYSGQLDKIPLVRLNPDNNIQYINYIVDKTGIRKQYTCCFEW